MTDNETRLLELFFEVQRGLPRQGPGNRDSTIKALALCTGLPPTPNVLDVGCGPGMQTIVLAESLAGSIIAVDNCDEYLDELRQRLETASLCERIEVRHADMADMGFREKTFDLIWSEGAAYILGMSEALRAWRPLLREQGYLAFTELVWLDEHPAGEVAEFFKSEYAAMTSVDEIKATIRGMGFELVGDFTLPDSAWWDDYYTPLEAKFPALKQKYQGDEEALGVIAMTEAEIDIRRRFGPSYGYHFFISRNTTPW